MKTKYKYKEPKHTSKHRISIRKWNAVFPSRGRWPFVYVMAYVCEDRIETHYYYTIWAKLVMLGLYPLMILVEGYKEAGSEVYRVWFDKKCGAFGSDMTYRNRGDGWSKIEKLVGRKL